MGAFVQSISETGCLAPHLSTLAEACQVFFLSLSCHCGASRLVATLYHAHHRENLRRQGLRRSCPNPLRTGWISCPMLPPPPDRHEPEGRSEFAERAYRKEVKSVSIDSTQNNVPSGGNFLTSWEYAQCGGGVWKSNPPFDPLRAESPALKAGEITGPLSPPGEV
jgi:hypothetical protein